MKNYWKIIIGFVGMFLMDTAITVGLIYLIDSNILRLLFVVIWVFYIIGLLRIFKILNSLCKDDGGFNDWCNQKNWRE